ncbi:MAG: hypothetical protein IPK19_05460 [Chloroflexi bacterium]|nr:hypothetical protein [Chloroflexota bacterium]
MMLFCHEPSEQRPFGWRPEDVHRLFLPHFDLVWQVLNPDTTTGSPSGWYRLAKRG